MNRIIVSSFFYTIPITGGEIVHSTLNYTRAAHYYIIEDISDIVLLIRRLCGVFLSSAVCIFFDCARALCLIYDRPCVLPAAILTIHSSYYSRFVVVNVLVLVVPVQRMCGRCSH